MFRKRLNQAPPCVVTADLYRHLVEQEQLESEADALAVVTEELTQVLLSCRVIYVNDQEWNFDDVLTQAFEKDGFAEICKLLALAGDDETRFKEANTKYLTLIAKSAYEVAESLAESVFQARKEEAETGHAADLYEQRYDLAGGF